MATRPLELDPDEMRRAGYRTVDMLVRHLSDPKAPPLRRAAPSEMRRRLAGPAPEQGAPYDDVLALLEHDVLPFRARGDHPRFFAFIPYCGTWPGALGDFVASAANVYASTWMEAAGPTQVELEVLGWFKEWVGYPPEAGGILVSGGSAANMTALACARERLVGPMSDDLVVYVPDQAHSSVARAARILGFRPGQVRVLPVGPGFRLRPETLRGAIEADLAAGRRPFFVSASGGATNTGAVDPLTELAAVAAAHGAWFHVDAAYGGFAALTERGREAMRGLELADSVTMDPHKWLFQSYECGCVLVRDGEALRHAFEIAPDYLLDAVPGEEEVNFSDLGLQLSRTSHAFKVWLSVHTFGLAAFREAIDTSLDLTGHAQRLVEASESLELVSPASLGMLCFRRRFDEARDEYESDAMHTELLAALEESGIGFVSSTRLRGRYALRLCVMNHTTRAEDVDAVLAFLASHPVERLESAPRRAADRYPDVRRGWLGHPSLAPASLTELPLFAGLSDEQAARVLALASERRADPGETVVAQWEGSRELYVVLEGSAGVVLDGETVATLTAGSVFGEIAALEWGAGFGYARTATVIAATSLRALVLSAADVGGIVRDVPVVGRRLRAIAQERLYRT